MGGHIVNIFEQNVPVFLFSCNSCACKLLLFTSVTNIELNDVFFDSWRDTISKFNNIHLDQSSGNVQACKYFEFNEIRDIFTESRKNICLSLLHVNIRSLSKNCDKLKLLLYGLDITPNLIDV